MTVTTTSTLQFFGFKKVSADMTGADGFFRGLAQSTGDASGGQHELIFQEPDDGQLPYRALLPLTLVIQQTSNGTGQGGFLRVYGKAQDDYEQTVQQLRQRSAIAAVGDDFYSIDLSNDDLAKSMRDRGWVVSTVGLGTSGNFRVVCELINQGAGVTITAYIFGLYRMVYQV